MVDQPVSSSGHPIIRPGACMQLLISVGKRDELAQPLSGCEPLVTVEAVT
jgi:hypothetical protein